MGGEIITSQFFVVFKDQYNYFVTTNTSIMDILPFTTYQLQIHISNYDGPSGTISEKIDLQELYQYIDVIKAINASENKGWNWFSSLPDKWDGSKYVDDNWLIEKRFEENFGCHLNASQIIAFYRKFTSYGADGISDITLYKVEKIEL